MADPRQRPWTWGDGFRRTVARVLLSCAVGLAMAACAADAGTATLASTSTPPSATEPDPAAGIERAEQFLQGRGTDLDPSVVLLLAYLERRFGLEWTAAQRQAVLSALPADDSTRSFARLVAPAARPEPAALASAQGVDGTTLQALYCDAVPLPAGYAETLGRMLASETGYEATHAALALQWAKENGCTLDIDLNPRVREVLSTLMAREGPTDVGIESAAFLVYTGNADLVPRDFVESIVAAQSPNGSWSDGQGQPASDHTTALALWVLLEASGSTPAPGPWVQRP